MNCVVIEFDYNYSHSALSALRGFGEIYNSSIHANLSLVIAVLGALVNAINLFILFRPVVRSPVNIILAVMSSCALSTMVLFIIYNTHQRNAPPPQSRTCDPHYFSQLWALFLTTYAWLVLVLHSAGIWLAVLLAAYRLYTISLRTPIAYIRGRRIWTMCLAVLGGVFAFAIPALTSHRTRAIDCVNNGRNETVYLSVVDAPCGTLRAAYWITGIMFKVVPILLLCLMSGLILKSMKDIKRRRSLVLKITRHQLSKTTVAHIRAIDRLTLMTLIVVLTSLITEIPQGLLAVLSAIYDHSFYSMVYAPLGNFVDLLSLINSIVNFVVYCFLNNAYRYEILRLCRSVTDGFKRRRTRSVAFQSGLSEIRCYMTSESLEASSARNIVTYV